MKKRSAPRRATPAAAAAPTAAAPRPGSDPHIGGAAAAAIYFALSFVYFLPAFLPGHHIYGTDYTPSSFFYHDFISQRLAAGALPQWVPHVYGGVPLFSNPGSMFYPVRWIADLIGPTSRIFPFIFWVQFGIAGWGMFLLARELGCRRWVAFLTGLAFQWTGILTSWVYAGHDGRIIVVSFAPLLFACLHRGIRTARLAPFAGAAAVLGTLLLSFQIQNAYYLLLASGLWAVFLLATLRVHRDLPRLGRTVALGVAAVAFGFALAAVNFLPFRDYVSASPRGMEGGRGYEYSTSFSMPVRALVGLAVPEQVGANVQNESGVPVYPVYRGANAFRLHTEYVGALVLLLLALGTYYSRRDRYWWFFAGLALLALSLALGGNTPLYRLYYAVLPGIQRFRAPDLAYYLAAFSLVCMAALTLERLATARAAPQPPPARGPVLLAGAGLVVLATAGALLFGVPAAHMAAGSIGPTPALGWLRFAFFAAASVAVLWAWFSWKLTSAAALLLLATVTVADLWVVGRTFFMTRPAPAITYAEDDITAYLRAQPGPFRFWVPGEATPWPRYVNAPMWYGLENVAGEHGNQLQRYNEFAGVGADTYTDFHNFNHFRFLAAANVAFIVSAVELDDPRLPVAFRGRDAIVYRNMGALPRAYLVPRAVEVEAGAALRAMQAEDWDPGVLAFVEGATLPDIPAAPLQGDASVLLHEPDRVVVRTTANRPALLVLADNWYPDWRARIGGEDAQVHLTNHTFRGVVVPAGTHDVEFVFRSAELRAGLAIHLAGVVVLACYGAWLLFTRLRRRRKPAGMSPAG
jgi:hypothetical protein